MSRSVVRLVEVRFGTSKGLIVLSPFSTGTGGVRDCPASLADSDRRSFAAGLLSGDNSKSHSISRRWQLLHRGPVSLHYESVSRSIEAWLRTIRDGHELKSTDGLDQFGRSWHVKLLAYFVFYIPWFSLIYIDCILFLIWYVIAFDALVAFVRGNSWLTSRLNDCSTEIDVQEDSSNWRTRIS